MPMTQLQCPGCQQMFQQDLVPGMDILSCPHCGQQMQAPPQAPGSPGQPRYYYSQDQVRYGPVEFGELQQLARSGRLQPNDYVVAEGQQEWTHAQTVPGLFSQGRGGPPPIPREPYDPGYPSQNDNPFANFFQWVWLHFRRAWQWDLRRIEVQPDETAALASQGVEDSTLQRYFAWRRSVMLMICVPVVLLALFNTIDQLQDNFRIYNALGVLWVTLQILAPFAMPVAVVMATILWSRRKISWRIIIVGWAVSFGIPIALYLVPGRWLIRSSPDMQMEQGMFIGRLLGLLILQLFVIVASVVFGMQRACLRLKTLVPESPVPGLFLTMSAPIFPIMLLPIFAFLNQASAHILLFIGVLTLMGSSLIYAICARVFFQPLASEKQFNAVRIVQWISKGLFWGGLLFLLIYGLAVQFGDNPSGGGRTLLGFSRSGSFFQVWQWRIIRFTLLEVPARSMFMVVLIADLFMRVTMSVWLFQRQLAQAGNYTDKMEKLHQSMNQTQFFKV